MRLIDVFTSVCEDFLVKYFSGSKFISVNRFAGPSKSICGSYIIIICCLQKLCLSFYFNDALYIVGYINIATNDNLKLCWGFCNFISLFTMTF